MVIVCMYVCIHEPWDQTMHACINLDKPVVGILSVGILSGWDFVRWDFVCWDFVLAPLRYDFSFNHFGTGCAVLFTPHCTKVYK